MSAPLQLVEQPLVLRGSLELIIRRRGNIVERDVESNLIVNVARQNMAKLLAGQGTNRSITQVAVGTNPNPPSPDDTAITTPFIKPINGFSYPTPTSVRFDFTILESEANGMAIVEFGLLAADGSLFARRTRSGKVIEKDQDLQIDGFWTILF